MLVGRSEGCDLRLEHPTVSGEHAVITWDADAWHLRDLGSTNGTRLDGRAVAAGEVVRLHLEASLQFGRESEPWVVTSVEPPVGPTGLTATAGASLVLDELTVRFVVSSDEEHVAWFVQHEGRVLELGDRVHTYLLLTLARARRDDADAPVAARGWRYADDLARRLGITPEVLKVYVYRARRQLLEAGVEGAERLIERRATSNQIRLGTDHVEIART